MRTKPANSECCFQSTDGTPIYRRGGFSVWFGVEGTGGVARVPMRNTGALPQQLEKSPEISGRQRVVVVDSLFLCCPIIIVVPFLFFAMSGNVYSCYIISKETLKELEVTRGDSKYQSYLSCTSKHAIPQSRNTPSNYSTLYNAASRPVVHYVAGQAIELSICNWITIIA